MVGLGGGNALRNRGWLAGMFGGWLGAVGWFVGGGSRGVELIG